ncbi:hypothetical protein [Clostridium beijerinckii]|uniref:hypothetical protein n=1 Tax=Clostridium beijerinckii TaxID=1520 RepID=UPI00098CDADC|nr:hypothetical protein [Clostridium beijerinckii]NRT78428.1 hypothetical protein [Clostridium beijerinckii]OOM47309.1 hypothetical protein CBEIJ_28750 [Clostridium beijerinckii]
MKKTRILGLALIGILSLSSVTAFASSTTFSKFALWDYQDNNYTTHKAKSTNYDYSSVKCETLTGTSKATFWIADDSEDSISDDLSTGESSKYKEIDYNQDLDSGDNVCLGMENYYSTSQTAYANGAVIYN